jgi:hypothetical protein
MLITVASMALIAAKAQKDAYIVAAQEGVTFSGGMSLQEWKAIRQAYPGKVLWVRRNGRDYLIRDETTILRAHALFAEDLQQSPERQAVGREQSKLDKEADRLEDKNRRTAAEDRRLDELHARLRVLAQREKELDDRQEALEREAERALWPLVDSAIRAGLAKPLTR